jgi:hypothetical protein
VHRDIKPANLFLVEGSPGWRAIKILDFGISKRFLAESSDVTTGVVMGSPCYMSPEQLGGAGPVDHRSDIWSLGATLYELLTGQRAFDPSRTLPELVSSVLHRPHADVRSVVPGLPAGLASIVDRCLAKKREERFESAAALARALSRFAPPSAAVLVERAATMAPAFPSASPASVRGPVVFRPSANLEGPVSEVRHMGHVVVAEGGGPPNSARATHGTLSLGAKLVVKGPPRRARLGLTAQLALAAGGACALGAWAAALVDRAPAPSTSALVLSSTVQRRAQTAAAAPSGAAAHRQNRESPSIETPPRAAAPANLIAFEPVPPTRRTPPAVSQLPSASSAGSPHPEVPPPAVTVGPAAVERSPVVDLSSVVEPDAVDPKQVDPAGGRAPVRPIETKNPYPSY